MATASFDTQHSTQAVIEPPMQSDGEIPIANVLPASRDFPDDAWLNIDNVPVFAEHETTTRGGRELKFGRWELNALCAKCNRRIRETGDYAGIVIGHTPSPESAQNAPPMPLIGLAGPFRVGLLRQPGGKARWAILADFHVQREQANAIRQYPRRSAELWVEDRYEDMYLDPIALLGAETPRLDMGLLYSAVHQRHGRQVEVEKYSACAPSATSVFVSTDDTHKPKRYAAADPDGDNQAAIPDKETITMTPEDIQQITAALDNLDWVQFVKKQMAAEQAIPDVPPVAADLPPAAPEVPPAAGNLPPVAADVPPAVPPVDDDNLPVRYSRLQSELATTNRTVEKLRGELDAERGKRINTERYAALAETRRTRLFDLDSEFELLKYGRATDQQFADHLKRINANYREIPLDMSLPTFDLPAGTSASRPGGQANKEKYSKDVSDKALRIAKEKAMRGETVSFEEVLESVASGKL
jgi:hypothetical protein